MVTVVSDAAGRMRLIVSWFQCYTVRAVAIEDAVAKVTGVRAVHACPRTGSVVVWYSAKHCGTSAVHDAIAHAGTIPAALVPARPPRSADVRNGDVLRMGPGGMTLAILGARRYLLGVPTLLGPTATLFATAITIATGYPFLRGAMRSIRSMGSAGTDLLVSAATVASLVLRENVVALTVLWLLNIGITDRN